MSARPPRRRAPESLARSVGTRAPRKRVVVFMEGALTEPRYLQGLKTCEVVKRASAVTLDLVPGAAVAFPLVERAVQRKSADEASKEAADEYWCVIDVEAPVPHPRLAEALEKRHRGDGTACPVDNPSSTVPNLLDAVGWRPPTTP